MAVVSNTSPLLNLATIAHLNLLRNGRARAKALGLQPIGVLGVLLRAKQDATLDSVQSAMSALQRQAGFFIAPELFEAILIEAGETD